MQKRLNHRAYYKHCRHVMTSVAFGDLSRLTHTMFFSKIDQIRQPFRARRLEPRRTFQLISKSTNLHIILLTPTQPFPRGTPRLVNSAGSVYFRCRISWTRFAVFSPNLINLLKAFLVQNWSNMRSKMEQNASKMLSKIHSVFEWVF